jgi:1-acyl-sn-glycerol-3-phosphate acyltransferase
MYLRLFFKVPFLIYRIGRYGKTEDKFVNHLEAFNYIKKWTTIVNRAGRVTIAAEGKENLPDSDGFIMFCNHQGLFDVLAFLEACPKPFAFIAKIEVANVILLKQIIAALGSYPLDRENLRQAMGVINSVAADVKKGKNFIIFPEGTRCPTRNAMGDFKGGSFKSATKAKCPIVPCALIDAHKPFDVMSIKAVTVKLRFLPPIYHHEYEGMKTVEIADMVKERIAVAMKEMLEE